VDPTGHFCVSSDGNNTRSGECNNNKDYLYLGGDSENIGKPILYDKSLVGFLTADNTVQWITTNYKGNYWEMYPDDKQQAYKVYVTKEQLISIYTKSGHFLKDKVADDMISRLNKSLDKYEITTTLQIRNFLAVTTHESHDALTEAGWLSEKKVREYTKRYEPGTTSGKNLGNTKAGDGYLFRGAGYIQLTGRSNYKALTKAMGDQGILNQGADYVAKKYAWEAAGYFWKNIGINNIIAKGVANKQDEMLTYKQV
jgi:predicted chitinase